jgi:hypothetical protein
MHLFSQGGGGGYGMERGGPTSLYPGIRIGFVIITKMNEVIISFRCGRDSLEANVISTSVSYPVEDCGFLSF